MTTSKLYEFRAELECALGLLEKECRQLLFRSQSLPTDRKGGR